MQDLKQAGDVEESLIEAPQGQAVRLLLRLGPVEPRAVSLPFNASVGVTPAIAHWTNALGGLALFPLQGERGALLIQDRRGAGELTEIGVFHLIQDPFADAWPWRDSSQSGWRVLRPPASAGLDRACRCEIAGVAFVSEHRGEPDERIILRARTHPRTGGSWLLEWPLLGCGGLPCVAMVASRGADSGPASSAAV